MNYDFWILLYVVGTSSVFEETTNSYFVKDIYMKLSTLNNTLETESAPIKRRKHVQDKTRQDKQALETQNRGFNFDVSLLF